MNKLQFENLDYNTILSNNNNHIIIEKEGEDFHIKLHLRENSENLLVFSNGAIDPMKKEPPIFMRESWIDDINYSVIFIDDKTVHGNTLKLGCGIGKKERHFIKDYSEIIKKIVYLSEIENQNIYYYGSSARGFMSMALATMHSETNAIVNNPQTYVFNYYKPTVNLLYETLFPDMTAQEIKKEYSTRLSITSRSEEHTSELQSRFDLVCRLLLEKRNTTNSYYIKYFYHNSLSSCLQYEFCTFFIFLILYDNLPPYRTCEY